MTRLTIKKNGIIVKNEQVNDIATHVQNLQSKCGIENTNIENDGKLHLLTYFDNMDNYCQATFICPVGTVKSNAANF